MIFDTNVFHGDVRADRSRLRAILDGEEANPDLHLHVPEVVLMELEKQFARRSKKVVKDVNKAIGDYEGELRELGLQGPAKMVRDDDDIKGYRKELETRLTSVGVEIAPRPSDLSPALDWSVKRRKPFKTNGEGFPDAVIWLTVLELVDQHEDDFVLVSSNTKDFGDGGTPPRLAEVLADDLEARGLSRRKVRLVDGIDAFANEREKSQAAFKAAVELAGANKLDQAIEDEVLFSRLAASELSLGIPLDEDPQVTSWDLQELEVESAAELPGERLLIHAIATISVLLDLIVHKADFYVESDPAVGVSVADPDWNSHYLNAEAEIVVNLELEIVTDVDVASAQVEIESVALAPEEIVRRALRGRGLTDLADVVRDETPGSAIDEYKPEALIESDLEEVNVEAVLSVGTPELREIITTDSDEYTCHLSIEVTADVSWVVTAPTPFDADSFASLALNEESGAPILQDIDSNVPLRIDLVATWDDEHGWHNAEVQEIVLQAEEAAARSGRMLPSEAAALEGLMDEADNGD